MAKSSKKQILIQVTQNRGILEEGLAICKISVPALENLNKLPPSIRLRKLKTLRRLLERFLEL